MNVGVHDGEFRRADRGRSDNEQERHGQGSQHGVTSLAAIVREVPRFAAASGA